MANHPRRSWRKQWTVDLAARQARHEPTGAVVQFDHGAGAAGEPADPAGTNPRHAVLDRLALIARLGAEHGDAAARQMVQRLERDALDVYQRALRHGQRD